MLLNLQRASTFSPPSPYFFEGTKIFNHVPINTAPRPLPAAAPPPPSCRDDSTARPRDGLSFAFLLHVPPPLPHRRHAAAPKTWTMMTISLSWLSRTTRPRQRSSALSRWHHLRQVLRDEACRYPAPQAPAQEHAP